MGAKHVCSGQQRVPSTHLSTSASSSLPPVGCKSTALTWKPSTPGLVVRGNFLAAPRPVILLCPSPRARVLSLCMPFKKAYRSSGAVAQALARWLSLSAMTSCGSRSHCSPTRALDGGGGAAQAVVAQRWAGPAPPARAFAAQDLTSSTAHTLARPLHRVAMCGRSLAGPCAYSGWPSPACARRLPCKVALRGVALGSRASARLAWLAHGARLRHVPGKCTTRR